MSTNGKATTTIAGRVPLELKQQFGEVAAELGLNESRAVDALARWLIANRRMPDDAPPPPPQAPPKVPFSQIETSFRRELAAACVLMARFACGTTPVDVPTAIEVVREALLSGLLQKEVSG